MTAEPITPALRVLPLGGCGEVGLNATLLLDGDDGILVDCGVLLGLPDAPGVERAIPDFTPLLKEGRRIHAVFVTHGHEDHIGAIPHLLRELPVPVYGPPLALAILRARMEDDRALCEHLHPLAAGSRVSVPPFEVELVRVTHSIPDSAALAIETRAGRVIHTGDFKLDACPADGVRTDVERLKALGDAGVDLLLADSTNAERPGRTRTETDVGLEIERQVREAEGRVVIACVASHLHRLQAALRAARTSGRRVALVGRALQVMWKIGVENKHLDSTVSPIVDDRRIEGVPDHQLLMVVTGTQGELRAGLSRVAYGAEKHLRLKRGDRVVLSATTIPGNERAVRRVVNALVRHGVDVVQGGMAAVHCSGHGHQEEHAEMLALLRPKCFVPIHGERSMLEAHARTAQRAGVAPERVLVIEDGQSVVLTAGAIRRGPSEDVAPRPVDVASGDLLEWSDVEDRRRLSFEGILFCTVAIDDKTGRPMGRPAILTKGVSLNGSHRARIESEVLLALASVAGERDANRNGLLRSTLKKALGPRLRPVIAVELITI